MVGPIAGANVTASANAASPIGCWAFGSLVSTMVKAMGVEHAAGKALQAAHDDHRAEVVSEGAGDRE